MTESDTDQKLELEGEHHPIFQMLLPSFQKPYNTLGIDYASQEFHGLSPDALTALWQNHNRPIDVRACAFDLYSRLASGQTSIIDPSTLYRHTTGYDTFYEKILPYQQLLIMLTNSHGRPNVTCNGRPALYLMKGTENDPAMTQVLTQKNNGGALHSIVMRLPASTHVETRQRGSQTDNTYSTEVLEYLQEGNQTDRFIYSQITESSDGHENTIQQIRNYDLEERTLHTILGVGCGISNFHMYSSEWVSYLTGIPCQQAPLSIVNASGHTMISGPVPCILGMPDIPTAVRNVLKYAPIEFSQDARLRLLLNNTTNLKAIIKDQYFDYSPLQFLLRPERFTLLQELLAQDYPHTGSAYFARSITMRLEAVYRDLLIADAREAEASEECIAITLEPNGPNEQFAMITRPTDLETQEGPLTLRWGIAIKPLPDGLSPESTVYTGK